MKILGIDPGLRATGWGVILHRNQAITFIDAGVISPPIKVPMAARLLFLFQHLNKTVETMAPDTVAVEEGFVNPPTAGVVSSLSLGQARGIALVVPALHNLSVSTYAPNQVKKAVVGHGRAPKDQVARVLAMLLPRMPDNLTHDAVDALAVALCHCHYGQSLPEA